MGLGLCPRCGASTHESPVPDYFRNILPADPPAISICERCLAVQPIADSTVAVPSFEAAGLPADPDAAVGVIILVSLCESLAHNRDAIAEIIDRLETRGVDPRLAIDRLADDPDLDLAVDLATRRRQLDQLIE